jgi:aminotransferase
MTRNFVSQRVCACSGGGDGLRPFFEIIATMADQVISLGIGEPDFDTPPNIIAAGVRALETGRTCYTSNYGTLELRQALVEHLNRLYNVIYDPARECIITVGVSEALVIALQAIVDPGDEIIVAEPCFTSYMPDVILCGATPIPVAARPEIDFQVSPADIEAVITPRTKAVLLNYPNNPTGAVMSCDKLTGIVELARRHDLLLISDEIYDRLVYGTAHVCLASLDREHTILLGGFSKDYAMTGWRVGYVCAPAALIEAMLRVHECFLMCASMPAQDAALEALRHGEEAVQEMVATYDQRRRVLVRGLNEIGLPTFEARGAFYAFPCVSHLGLGDTQFAQGLLQEEKVAVVPGSAFGVSGRGFIRACYAQKMDLIEEALERIEHFVRPRK